MALTGLGQDGYSRFQKETVYGTDVTSSMTLLPVKEGSLIKAVVQPIENKNIISSRLPQKPDQGRNVVSGQVMLDFHPTLMGALFNLFLGTSTDGSVVDSTYEHTWLSPVTGTKIGKSFTYQQALGTDLADQFSGGILTKMKLESDSSGHIGVTFDAVFQDYTENVARISTFSYPTAIPFIFAFASLNIDPAGVSAFDQPMNSFSLEIDLGYDIERFKLGSKNIIEPIYKTIPTLKFNANIDADQQYMDYLRAYTDIDVLTLTMLSTENAAGTTPFRTIFEIPECRINSDNSIPNTNDLLTMDLEFTAHGGLTTGSPSTPVLFELRHRDAVAAYA